MNIGMDLSASLAPAVLLYTFKFTAVGYKFSLFSQFSIADLLSSLVTDKRPDTRQNVTSHKWQKAFPGIPPQGLGRCFTCSRGSITDDCITKTSTFRWAKGWRGAGQVHG